MTRFLVHSSVVRSSGDLISALGAARSTPDVLTADSDDEVVATYRHRSPDVVMLEADLPDLLLTIGRLRSIDPAARILVVGNGDRPAVAAEALVHGARGYLRRLDDGPLTMGNSAVRQRRWPTMATGPTLTPREAQVLVGMSEGRSNLEIGAELFLTEDTIKSHARRLFRKLVVMDRAHAVAEGFRRGLLR